MPKLDQTQIEAMHAVCIAELDLKLRSTNQENDIHRLDATVFLDNLAWRILVPMLVSITGAVLSKAAEKLLQRTKDNSKNWKDEAKGMVGKEFNPLNDTEYIQCVDQIEQILGNVGCNRRDAEAILKKLIKEIDAGPQE